MPPDSYDDALQGNDQALGGRHLAIFNPVDESTGVFEIAVEAPDRAAALQRVVDAVAAAGADDHVLVAENPHSQPEGT